jgi:hypothetical protein
MGVIHRNDINLGAKSSTSAGHGGSKADKLNSFKRTSAPTTQHRTDATI